MTRKHWVIVVKVNKSVLFSLSDGREFVLTQSPKSKCHIIWYVIYHIWYHVLCDIWYKTTLSSIESKSKKIVVVVVVVVVAVVIVIIVGHRNLTLKFGQIGSIISHILFLLLLSLFQFYCCCWSRNLALNQVINMWDLLLLFFFVIDFLFL